MSKVWLLALLGASMGVSAVRVMDSLGVLIVHTPSVAEGVYLRRPVDASALRLGEVVCLDATSSLAPAVLRKGVEAGRFPAVWQREPLVKHVAALGGAAIGYDGVGAVVVNGEVLPNSVRKDVDLEGKILPAPKVPARIPLGHVWLASSHPDGFDSRYMGPVDVRALSCVAEALWLF